MTPLWKGPVEDGVTSSLLANYITCKERFRLKVIEGLHEEDEFDYTIEFGQMWHEIKEAYRTKRDWKKSLGDYRDKLWAKYPANIAEINKWAYICAGQFMVWLNRPRPAVTPQRVKEHQLITEDTFRVEYILPSGRPIIFRGKYDSILLAGNSLYIEDDKSKGYIDELAISGTLLGNLQMGVYHTAARQSLQQDDKGKYRIYGLTKRGSVEVPASATKPYFAGTRYQVVRRPLNEKFPPVRQKSKETDKEFWDRLIQHIAGNYDYYFKTMPAMMSTSALNSFKLKILHPICEELLDWWDFMVECKFDPWTSPHGSHNNRLHYQTPWGVYNSLFGGFRGDFFEYLTKGSDRALVKLQTLFPELESDDNANPKSKIPKRPKTRNSVG
jgi:hypothetical protein